MSFTAARAVALALFLFGTARAALPAYDQAFLRAEAQGSAYELAIAQLAQQRASRADVRGYAATVVNDHEAYNGALRELAQAKGVALPPGLTARDRGTLDRLGRLQGAAFDGAFLREARRINDDDVRSFRQEAARTADPDVKAFVTRFVEVDAKHAAAARALAGHAIASRMPVIAPPATGNAMPVITPPAAGTMPVIPPPGPITR